MKTLESTTDAAGGCSVQRLVLQPFYDVAGITIYCGDNRKILPLLGDYDLLLTDPPYGIKAATSRNGKTKPDGRWKGRKQREYYGESGDDKPRAIEVPKANHLGRQLLPAAAVAVLAGVGQGHRRKLIR